MEYMRKILLLVFVLVSFSAIGQVVQFPTNYGVGYRRTGADTLLWIPTDTFSVPGALSARTHIARKGGNLYYWTGTKWQGLSGGVTDTTSLSNRINLKVNISDTATMLANYRHWLAGYIKGTDTAAMLSPYLRSNVAAATYATISNLALKLNITDTANKWITSIYRKTASDSVFYTKGSSHTFAFKDSVGGGGSLGSLDTLPYPNWTVVQDGGGTSYKTHGQRVFNVKDYGATGDGSTDDTRAIQAAINAAHANFGGVVYFPIGKYIIADSLRTTSVAGNPNAQLYIPLSPYSANTDSLRTIELLGEVSPNYFEEATARKMSSSKGVMLISTLRHTGAILGSASETVSWGNFNFVTLVIKNIGFRVDTDSSGITVAAKSTAVDARKIAVLLMEHSKCDVDTPFASVTPLSTAYGIRTPARYNWVVQKIQDVAISGYYTAIEVNEHANMSDILIDVCYNGLEYLAGDHTAHADHIVVARCKNVIKVTGVIPFTIDDLGIEWKTNGMPPTGAWFTTDYGVLNNAGSNAIGFIKYSIAESGVGFDNTKWNMSSYNNYIRAMPNYNAIPSWTTTNRPPAANGEIGWNSTTGNLEFRNPVLGSMQTVGSSRGTGAIGYDEGNGAAFSTGPGWYGNTLYAIGAANGVGLTLGHNSGNQTTDINTNNINGALRIYGGTTASTGPKIEFWPSGSTFKGMYIDAGNATGADIFFRTTASGAATAMTIKQNTGLIGIGTTSPDSLLTVEGGGVWLKRGLRVSGVPSGGTSSDSIAVIGSDGQIKKMNASGISGGSISDSSKFTLQRDTISLASFGAGGGNAGDTVSFSTSTIYGSFYNDGSDTLVITSIRAVVQGSSASITPTVYYNDSLNVTAGATKLVNSPSALTNTTTGVSSTPDNSKIPPGVWVWVSTATVTTKPTYFSLTLLGYKKRK